MTRERVRELLDSRPHGTREAFLRANELKRLSPTAAARWHWANVARKLARHLRRES